jgi:hypothetical protein
VTLVVIGIGIALALGLTSGKAQGQDAELSTEVWPDRYRIVVAETRAGYARPILLDGGAGASWVLEDWKEWRKLPITEKPAIGGK